jgi:hypothetical protein
MTANDTLRNANSSQNAFSRPKKGRFHKLQQCIIQYVHEKRNKVFPVMREVKHIKMLELPLQMQIPVKFTASTI